MFQMIYKYPLIALCCKNTEEPGSQQKALIQLSCVFVTPPFSTLIKQQERKENLPRSFPKQLQYFCSFCFSLACKNYSPGFVATAIMTAAKGFQL